MSPTFRVWALPFNPEPWALGPILVLPGKGGKGHFGKHAPHKPLVMYQKAIKSELLELGVEVEPGMYAMRLTFSRQIETYQTKNGTVTRNAADVTNMQKATEDALEKVAIHNDRAVLKTVSQMYGPQLALTEPFVVIELISGITWKDPRGLWNCPGEFLSEEAEAAIEGMNNSSLLSPDISNNEWKP